MTMTREEFKAKVSMALGSMERETWEDFLEAVWQLHLEASNHWIPVEEELPPENGKTQQSISVWATNGLTSGEFRYNFDTKTWTDMWGDPFDITHWIPCPQLPRKEEE